MTTRWEVEQAVLRSNLDPPARLLLLVLAVKADNESAIVPAAFTPSLSTLAAATGLSRSTVAAHLNKLEALGWVKRSRPPATARDERTCYALATGSSSPGDGLVRETDRPRRGQTARVVRETDHSGSPGDGPGVVRETDPGSPPAGHASSKNSSTKSSSSKGTKQWAAEPANDDDPPGPTERILTGWQATLTVPVHPEIMQAIAGYVHQSVVAKIPEADIAEALRLWQSKIAAGERVGPKLLPTLITQVSQRVPSTDLVPVGNVIDLRSRGTPIDARPSRRDIEFERNAELVKQLKAEEDQRGAV